MISNSGEILSYEVPLLMLSHRYSDEADEADTDSDPSTCPLYSRSHSHWTVQVQVNSATQEGSSKNRANSFLINFFTSRAVDRE